MNKKELWLRIFDYHFEDVVPPGLIERVMAKFGGADASTKAFAHKLARKEKWIDAFALRAVSEYKRFVYLGVVSDFVVTPSAIIDKVWHQHILFSKAYRNFCTNVIQYDFDHSPEIISATGQTETFKAQYQDTLELYKKEFGFNAPTAIWGATKFDANEVMSNTYRSKKKEKIMGSFDGSYYSTSVPLFDSFDENNGETFTDFGGYGGGSFSGAGAGSSWGDAAAESTDSGSSCSSCSSGCGGGGGD